MLLGTDAPTLSPSNTKGLDDLSAQELPSIAIGPEKTVVITRSAVIEFLSVVRPLLIMGYGSDQVFEKSL